MEGLQSKNAQKSDSKVDFALQISQFSEKTAIPLVCI